MKKIVRSLQTFFSIIFLLGSLSACNTLDSSKLNPNAATTNVELGLAYLHQGDVVRAKSKLLLALDQSPNDAMVQDAFGYFLEVTGRSELAEEYYLRAIHFAKDRGAAWNNYGAFLYRQKKYQSAMKYFLLAAQDLHYLQVATAYKNAGYAAKKLHQEQLANQYFDMANAN